MNASANAALVAVACILLGGCATLVKGSSQGVQVATGEVKDAECVLTSPEIGQMTVRTPGVVTLSKSKHDVHVTCTKEGYEKSTAIIRSNFEGWTVGNILFGGLIGVGVDAASGAMHQYDNSISVPMRRADGVQTSDRTKLHIRWRRWGG